MTKILVGWVVLVAISGVAFAKDEKVEGRFEGHQRKFVEAAMRACAGDLNAVVLEFPSGKRRDPEAKQIKIEIKEDKIPYAESVDIKVNGTLLTFDLSKKISDPADAIRYLELIKKHGVDERVLEVRKYGLRVFGYRMAAIKTGEGFLSPDEVNRYSLLLAMSVQDIYHGSDVGEDPLGPTLNFLMGVDNPLDMQITHQFLAAILATVDIPAAYRAYGYFKFVTDRWYSERNHLGMSSPYDDRVLANFQQHRGDKDIDE